MAFGSQATGDRLDNGLHRRVDQFGRGDRGGGIGAHAAGIGAGIAFADAFVILRRAAIEHGLAIAQREDGDFLAGHELLDHQGLGRFAELARQEGVDLGFRLGAILQDHHTLAGGQTVGLEHIGRLDAVEEGLRFGRIGESAIAGGGHFVAGVEILGIGLGRFQPCRQARRAESGDTGLAQPVGQAVAQRVFRADNDQVRLDLPGQFDKAVNIGHRAVMTGRQLADGIAARYGVQGRQERALRDLPGQRVFAAARTDKENLHLDLMPLGASRRRLCVRALPSPKRSGSRVRRTVAMRGDTSYQMRHERRARKHPRILSLRTGRRAEAHG